MSKKQILLDTGPLVSLIASDESAHEICIETVFSLTGDLITCWPVVTEAAWLLRNTTNTLNAMLTWVETGTVQIAELRAADLSEVRAILERFASLKPQFADACLVHLAEREGIDTIFTLDRRDFSVYRTRRGKAFRLLPETSR